MEPTKKQCRSLQKFDFETVKSNRAIAIAVIGKRACGKTTLISDIVINQNIPYIVMSRDICNHKNHIEIYSRYDKERVERLINDQKSHSRNFEYDTNPEIGLLVDDCSNIDNNLRDIIMSGRHIRTNIILGLQYPTKSDVSVNFDYVFCFNNKIISYQKLLYQRFFGSFETFEEFQEVFNEYTKDYGCLVIDQTERSNKVEDCIFYYKLEN